MAQPIKISINADARGVKAGVDQANAQLNRLNQSAKDSQQSLQNIDKGFSNLTRATAAVGAGIELVGVEHLGDAVEALGLAGPAG